jgi:hypothetical protein
MSAEQMTTSAALYFAREQGQSVSMRWFEWARELFNEYKLSPILFTAGGEDFLLDDCYVLAELGNDIVDDEGYVLAARGGDLVDSLRNGAIESLFLDSPRSLAGGRSNWRAAVNVSLTRGAFYVGLDENLVPDPSALLRRACGIAKGLFDVRYGIAYKSPLAQYPDGHASGFVNTSTAEVFEWIRHRHEWDRREKSPDELWTDELWGERRHLAGLFRGAYSASILSESHLRAAALTSSGLGRLSELDASRWLWELSDSELPVAEAMLESRRVLVSQAGHAK